jgi:phospholipase C
MYRKVPTLLIAVTVAVCLMTSAALADGNLKNVNHIIIVMQENHSFDNYFGVLGYAPGSPYHNGNGSCSRTDHTCVDGLTCTVNNGAYTCTNSNINQSGSTINAFKATIRCTIPDLDHSWVGVHYELNFENPNNGLKDPLSDGFVRQNYLTEQPNTLYGTMGFYNQDDLPFYYGLAENFAINDREFSSLLGPTFPNRSYLMAATSFGHLTTSDIIPPVVGYKPITGTIFDQLDKHGVTWADYWEDVPQDASFRPTDVDNNLPLAEFFLQASGVGELPEVSFIDPNFGSISSEAENDEHPPTDIQRGQYHVSQVINAVRNGPYWKDSVIFILYDEHGGFYDHAKPPQAPQTSARTPDGIFPGQCEDLSFPPFSEYPGGGAECSWNFVSTTDTSVNDAEQLCPAMSNNPTGPFPTSCASFNQLGIRVPLIAVSPFSKPAYVSHTIGDHTSMIAFIENRFLPGVHLTKRDQYANDLEDMFDFNTSPSLNTAVGSAQPPQDDCTPPRAPGESTEKYRGWD